MNCILAQTFPKAKILHDQSYFGSDSISGIAELFVYFKMWRFRPQQKEKRSSLYLQWPSWSRSTLGVPMNVICAQAPCSLKQRGHIKCCDAWEKCPVILLYHAKLFLLWSIQNWFHFSLPIHICDILTGMLEVEWTSTRVLDSEVTQKETYRSFQTSSP